MMVDITTSLTFKCLPMWTREIQGIKDILGRGSSVCEVTDV